VARAAPIGRLVCARAESERVGVHLELFARGRVVIVPHGIGLAAPLRRQGRYLASSRCSYPVRTREATGVIEVENDARLTLGDFFDVWGRPLGGRRFLSFALHAGERVRGYVNGRPWRADPRAIPLRRHDQIVLELGQYIPPHRSYRFQKGL
jgi:hypothetical protein